MPTISVLSGMKAKLSALDSKHLKFKVYLLTSPSGKIYVGYTKTSMYRRFVCHVRDANANQKRPICQAIRKYGLHTFTVRVLKSFATEKEAKAYEIAQIAKRKARTKNIGYNVGEGGETFPAGYNGSYWTRGKTQKEIAAINAKKGRSGYDNGFYGQTHSDETKAKIVAKRMLRGSYDTSYNRTEVKYRGKKYASKTQLRQHLGIGKSALEALIKVGEVKVIGKQHEAVARRSQAQKQRVVVAGTIYESHVHCRTSLGIGTRRFYKMLNSGEIKCLQYPS